MLPSDSLIFTDPLLIWSDPSDTTAQLNLSVRLIHMGRLLSLFLLALLSFQSIPNTAAMFEYEQDSSPDDIEYYSSNIGVLGLQSELKSAGLGYTLSNQFINESSGNSSASFDGIIINEIDFNSKHFLFYVDITNTEDHTKIASLDSSGEINELNSIDTYITKVYALADSCILLSIDSNDNTIISTMNESGEVTEISSFDESLYLQHSLANGQLFILSQANNSISLYKVVGPSLETVTERV